MKYSCPMHPEVSQDKPGSCSICGMALENPFQQDFEELSYIRRRFIFSVILTVPVLYLSMVLHRYGTIQALLSTPVVLWGGLIFFQRGWQSIVSKKLNMFTLISLGVSTAYIFSLCKIFTRTIDLEPQLYFEAASVITTLSLLGQVLELGARNKAGGAIYKLLNLAPKTARLVQSNHEELDIPIEKVKKGDAIRVKPGEKVPIDGVIIEGSGVIDESMMSGEALGVKKNLGDAVTGATLNINGSFIMRVDKIGDETFLSRIVKQVSAAQRSKAPIQKLADSVAAIFVPIVIVIAVITLLAWGLIFNDVSKGLINGISVLIVACPCALGLATPMSLMVGIGQAALEGIFIKDGTALQELAKVRSIAFDKTGTLTDGIPQVTKIIPIEGRSSGTLIQIAASLEIASDHPLSAPIVEEAQKQKIQRLSVENFTSIHGKGVVGSLEGKNTLVGSLKLMESYKIPISSELQNKIQSELKDQSAVFIAQDDHILGFITIEDTIKSSSKDTIRNLRKAGIEVIMISGDRKQTAESVAQSLEIDHVEAEVLPEDKGKIIEKIKKQRGPVAMAGDGINDAVALTLADVGIAMGKGSDIALESASVTLLSGDLEGIVRARELSHSTLINIRQNLYFAFVYNCLGIPIATGIFYPIWGIELSPMIASSAMMLSSVSIILNALRLKKTS